MESSFNNTNLKEENLSSEDDIYAQVRSEGIEMDDSRSSSMIEYRLKMENKSTQQLQAELKKRKLSTRGTKRQLLQRILAFGNKSQLAEPVRDHQNVSISSSSRLQMLRLKELELIRGEKDLLERKRSLIELEKKLLEMTQTQQIETPTIICSVSEIADMLPSFSPGQIGTLTAEEWVNRVENLKKLFGWDERDLFMAAISKLQGPARLWWNTSVELTVSWDQLVSALKLYFPKKYSEFEVHQELMRRIRQPNENIEQYCMEINMLGKKINLSDKAIIEYCLTGLNDHRMSSSLAGVNIKNTMELVQKIKFYESIFKKNF